MPTVSRLGDTALIVTFGRSITREVGAHVRSVAETVKRRQLRGVIDVVPAYTTLALHFDPIVTTFEQLSAQVDEVLRGPLEPAADSDRLFEIPVLYTGIDLDEVAERTSLTIPQVIERHAAPTYHVYMLGFAPGFAYLGDLDQALVLERRPNPRKRVPMGSVAIAGAQTAVYPLATPGGWHILGTTAFVMFDPERDPPALLQVGDAVRFVPVSS